jgi:hypothetical protein
MLTDIEQAIKNLRSSAIRYDKPDRYYRGDHDLAFATAKFENTFGSLFREFALNLCPAICDAVRDKLKITGFSVSSPVDNSVCRPHASKDAVVPTSDSDPEDYSDKNLRSAFHNPHSAIESIWDSNQMDLTAEEIHLEALKLGDSYAIVWPDERGNVAIYPQRAAACTVIYDDEIPGLMRFAAKYWRRSDGFVRLNLLYPDRIEKYVSRGRSELALPDAREFVTPGTQASSPASVATDADVLGVISNPFNQIPLFHFSNTSEIGTFGKSELSQAIPIQNGLNKAVLDMLVAMEFSAFRQRWVSGLEVEYNEAGEAIPPFKLGVDRLWLSGDPQTTFGDFNTTDLDQFLKVKDSFRVDMASVTGTPLHYFLQSIRGFASGEALGRAEARFLAKVRDRQKAFGQVWSRMMSFALKVAGAGDDIRLRTQWQDPAPLSEKELLENLILKKRLGISTEQALTEAGYGQADITQMLQKPARVRSPHVSKGSVNQKTSRLPGTTEPNRQKHDR